MKKTVIVAACLIMCTVSLGYGSGDYRGDERCPPPQDWSRYSEPYEPLDHQYDYPTYAKADLPGWACSYQREDGVVVQYGDSRTPQEQWQAVWGNSSDNSQ